MTQVFISYSRKNLSFVERLAADLEKAGLEVWYDLTDLEGGVRWRPEIENAIRNSQFVTVVLSPESVKSEWVEREFLFASNLGRTIIPLLYRPCELPLNYVDLNYIDMQGVKYGLNFDELLQALSVDKAEEGYQHSKIHRSRAAPRTGYVIAILGVSFVAVAVLLVIPLVDKWSIPGAFNPHPDPSDFFDKVGVPMRLVPAGIFTMGGSVDEAMAKCQKYYDDCDRSWFANEAPPHQVSLDAFYIDKYEVTNLLYKACVEDGVCTSPREASSNTHSRYYGNPDFDRYPVVYVDWDQAQNYCEWRAGGLPTEAQWEKAARGTEGRTYPWGEGIDCTKANYFDSRHNNFCEGDVTEVGAYDNGISPYGIYDLAGNVWEWTADWFSETYYQNSPSANPIGPKPGSYRTLRGGAWSDDEIDLWASVRGGADPKRTESYIGFRCAKDAIP